MLDWIILIKGQMSLCIYISYYNFHKTNVQVLMLDASKAFDKVKYCKLFNEILNRNVSPLILRLLSVLYTNQTLQVKWKSITGAGFSVLNGVKQCGVLSPVLFSVCIDGLLRWLSKIVVRCYMGNKFMGAVSFADDIKLLTPMFKGLKKLVSIWRNMLRSMTLS